ncbi:polysaccharide deacetylase family protein [Imbroritus primus]|uniref:polysaccharide deacetylase family protein n=1 Tax=Imbroritus primus TaxID=3058603 RepID=UPI003D1609A1
MLPIRPIRPLRLKRLFAVCLTGWLAAGMLLAGSASAADACRGTLYLTFDTGSMSQAQLIADTLRRHHIRATFFVASEPTVHGDRSLDDGWKTYWKSLAADGHAFGTHTFDHVYLVGDDGADGIRVRPQFGPAAGQVQRWDQSAFCAELKRTATRFAALTGRPLDHLWRAPGGRTSPRTLAWAEQCGFRHVGWDPAGFLGDELSSERYPNARLLTQALERLKDGDIAMAHLGIWSRRDPWAPAVLEPLLTGLQARGFCFATIPEHPRYRQASANRSPR